MLLSLPVGLGAIYVIVRASDSHSAYSAFAYAVGAAALVAVGLYAVASTAVVYATGTTVKRVVAIHCLILTAVLLFAAFWR
jgi:hypothetical protein